MPAAKRTSGYSLSCSCSASRYGLGMKWLNMSIFMVLERSQNAPLCLHQLLGASFRELLVDARLRGLGELFELRKQVREIRLAQVLVESLLRAPPLDEE